MIRTGFLTILALAALPLPGLAQEAALSDYVVFGCRQGGAGLTPFVFRRDATGLAAVTGEGTGDVTDGGRIVQVSEPDPGTVVVTRGPTTIRFTDSAMTTLGATGGSESTACLRLDQAFLSALGAVAGDQLSTGRVSEEIAALQRDQLTRQTAAAEAEAEAARATEARDAERARRQPTVENWHIGGSSYASGTAGTPPTPPTPPSMGNGSDWTDTDLVTAYILSGRPLGDSPSDRRLRRQLERLYDQLGDALDRGDGWGHGGDHGGRPPHWDENRPRR